MSDDDKQVASDESAEPQSMLDAISEGLASEAEPAAESGEQPADGGAGDVEAQQAASTDTPAAPEAVEGSADAESATPSGPEGVAEADTVGATEAAAADTAPAEAGADEAQATAPTDELAAPEGLTEHARDRFQKLAERAKEHEQQATQYKTQYEQLTTTIRDAGATPDDMQAFLDFTRARSAGNMDAALNILDAQRKDIAIASGRAVPGVDMLAAHPDLKERVASFDLAQDTAEEIARARESVARVEAQNAQRQQAAEQQQAQAQQQQATQAAQQQGALAVGQLEAQWRQSDPDFAMKEGLLKDQIQTIARTFPPEQWAAQIKWQYDSLGRMARTVAPSTRTPAPLTGASTTANANGAVPGSMHEAMWGESG